MTVIQPSRQSRQDEHLLDVALTRARLGLQSASHVHDALAVGVAAL